MRKLTFILGILALSLQYSFSQSFHVIENFDSGTNGFTASGNSSAQPWSLTTVYSVSTPNSYLGKIPTTSGYSIILTSPTYDLTNYLYVYLHFDHICKVDLSDTIRIEYSEEINGTFSSWKPLPLASYKGGSIRYTPQMAFNEGSYPDWDPNANSNPAASWWKHETFDLYSVVGGAKTQFRFVIKKGTNPVSFMRYGWLVDNVEVIGEVFEIKAPTVEFIDPVTDTITTTGPFDIQAKVKTNTSYPIQQPHLVYTSSSDNDPPQTVSVAMQNMEGDSLWKATIPAFVIGTTVTYSITGEDMRGNTDSVKESYYIKSPVSDSNSVILDSFDAPLQWQVEAGIPIDIDITIRNVGIKDLDSVLVSWTLNGDTIDAFIWKSNSGGLPWNFTDSVRVGSYTPRPDMYDTIVVWISMPNGETDPNLIRDRRTTTILYGCTGGLEGEYIVGPYPGAHYANLGAILSRIQDCHLADHIVIKLQDTTYTTGWTISNLKDAVYDKTITITSLSGTRESVVIKPSSGVGITLSNTNNLILDGISIQTSGSHSIDFSNMCENITVNNCKITVSNGYGINASTGAAGSSLTVKNSLIDGAGTAIYFLGTTSNRHKNITIDNNTFSNTTGTSLSLQRCLINSVSYNTITAHPTSGSSWKGIYITDTPKGGKVIGNKIHSVNNVNTTKTGFEITSSTSDSLFLANNEIHISYIGSSTSIGIRVNGLTNSQCLHNTVVLTGSGQLRAFSWEGTNSNVSLLNNILVANGTNSTTFGLYMANAYASSNNIDYNNYYSSAKLASVNRIDKATLPELQSTITSDKYSVNQYPGFIDSTADLQLSNYDPFYCPVLSNVLTDFTGNPRIGTTNMGCYTFNYQSNAQLVEVLNWPQTPMTTDTDSIWVVIRNGGHSTITSTTVSYTMNGTTDTKNGNGSLDTDEKEAIYLGRISYQKGYNNLMVCLNSSTPADVLSLDDTLRLRTYACSGALPAGTYTVGDSPTHDFIDMEEVALHLTQCGISGPVTINFSNGIYVQNTSIGSIPGSSTTNTVTISSISGNRESVTFQRSDNGLSMQAPIMLEGASNIIFKNVSFSGVSPHSNPSYSYAYALNINAPSQNIIVDSCHLYVPAGVGQSNDNHVVLRAASISRDIHIMNSLIEGGYTGIRVDGQANNIRANNITIENNIIRNVDGYGIYLYAANGNILRNTITQRSGDFDQTNNLSGIYSQYSRGDIIGNRIYALAISAGIYTVNFNAANNRGLIANNEIIGNVRNNAAQNKCGIYLGNSTYPSYANVYHNSIFIEATYVPTNNNPVTGIHVVTPSTTVAIRNNNLVTNTVNVNYPLYLGANTGFQWVIEGNNYYSKTGVIGFAQGESLRTLAAWRKIVYSDGTSVNISPRFFDPGKDLTLSDYSGITATPLSLVSDDINHVTRVNPTTIGAYQYEYKNNDAKPNMLLAPSPLVETGVPTFGKVSIQNLGLDTLKSIEITYMLNGQTIATQSWTGRLAQGEISDTIPLNTAFSPIEGMNSLTIYTHSPNGQPDEFAYNDTLVSEIYACTGDPISGPFTLNQNGNEDFASFAEVTNKLTKCGISGPVTIHVVPGVYNEDIVLGAIIGSSAVNTVTFVPSTIGEVSIVGPKTALTLTNTSHVYFKDISIYGKEKAIVFEKTCTDIEFRRCNIVADTTATTVGYQCVYYNNEAGSGNKLDNIRLINNSIKGGYSNIHFVYPGSDYSNMGHLTIDSNRMEKAYAAATATASVLINGFTSLESFSNNIITTRNISAAQRGVLLQNLWITGKMTKNKIIVNSTSGSSSVLQLVTVNNGSVFYDTYGNALITNNEIIRSSLTGGTGIGIRFETSNADFFHNTVLLNVYSGGTGYAAQINSIDRSLRIKNNIIFAHGSASYPTTPVALSTNNNRIHASRDVGTELDYNNYYCLNGQNLAMLGYQLNPVNFDMTHLRQITGQDEHSTNILPTFVNDNISLELKSVVGFQVPALVEVPEDFNGNSRLQPTYMGAHGGTSENIIDAHILSFIGLDEAMADGNSYPISIVIGNNGNTIIPQSAGSVSGTVNAIPFNSITAPKKALAYQETDTIALGTFIFNTAENPLIAAVTLSGDTNQRNDTIKISRSMCNERIEGTYTVGASSPDFDEFNTFWTKAQSCGIGGNVILQFETGTYSGTMNLSNWDDFSNGYTLTITSLKQHQDSVIFTHTANLMTFNKTSNVVLDKITLDASTAGNTVQFSGNTSNIIIANSKIMANPVDTSNTNRCIYKGTTGTLNGLTIENCVINGGHTAITLSGQDYDYTKNIIIDGNTISNQASRGIYGNYSRLWKITNNKITARSSSMTSPSWTAISVNQSRESMTIESNRIFAGNSSISDSLYGIQTQNIYVGSVVNNDIYLYSNASLVRGIEIQTPKDVAFLHNSVFVTGSGGTTSFTAAYLNVGTTAYNTNIYNNVFVAEGGENPYAIYFDGESYTPNLFPYYRTNGNVYYSSINLAYVSGNACPNIETWKFIALNDTNSVSIRPAFININQDLRIETAYDLLINRLPQIDKDKDGILRNPSTARGAYEFNYANVDASLVQFVNTSVPEINQDMNVSVELINLGTTSLISATIKWSINGVMQDSVIWSGNLTMAQKQTVFLGSTPLIWGRNDIKAWASTAYDINNGNDTIELVVYPCSGTMEGTFTIGGQTPDFTTINDAITALGICGISKPVVLELAPGTYPDIMLLDSIPGMSTTNTITFTSAGGNPNNVVISTNSVGIILRNISHLRFENMTIDATRGSKGIQFLSGCEDIEIRNCRILLNTTSVLNTHAGISKGNSVGIANNIRIINNTINGGYYGIHFNGGISIADYGTDIIIDSNTITNNYGEGIRVLYSHIPSLSYNRIEATNSSTFSNWYGIYLEYSNGIVNANRILQQSMINLPRGIYLKHFNYYLVENDTGLISNNEIIIHGLSYADVLFSGIHIDSYITADIVNNSILANGSNSIGTALYLGYTGISGSIKNNILISTTDNPAIYVSSSSLSQLNAALANVIINYNNYYSTSGIVGYLGGSTPERRPALADWVATVSTDINSSNINPSFVNPSVNLELSDYTLFYTVGYPKVITDINGKLRTVYTTKGAYGLTVREGYDLELSSIIIGSGYEEDLCKEDYVPVKYLVRNGGNLPYDFATDTMNLHFSMATVDGLLDFDTIVTIRTNELGVFLTDTFEIKGNLNVSFAGDYQITAWLSSGKDVVYSNDTIRMIYRTNKITLPYDNNFSTNILENIRIDSMYNTGGMWKVVQRSYDTIIQPDFGTGKLVFDDPDGSISMITIGQLELNRTLQPKLEFWYAHDSSHHDHDDLLDVRVNYDGIDSTLQTIFRYDRNYTHPTWVKYSYDLSYFQNASCVTVYFMGISRGTAQHIDRIMISSDRDISIQSISTSPLSICNLTNQKLEVMIHNETNQNMDFDLAQNQTIVHVEVKKDGVMEQTFRHPISGMLPGLTSKTVEVSSDFDFALGTYDIKAYLEMSIPDADPLNDIRDTSITINPKMSVTIDPVSGNNACLYGESQIFQEVTITNTGNMELSGMELILHIDTGGISSPYYITLRETIPGIIPARGFIKHTFSKSYIVPWNSEYYLNAIVYVGCDSTLLNGEASEKECVDMKDAYIVELNTPSGGVDKSGELINLGVTIRNRSDVESFSGMQITAIIEDSEGDKLAEFRESGLSLTPLETMPYIFKNQYTVPRDTIYYITLYIDQVDAYAHNDTVKITRRTDYVIGMEQVERVSISMDQNIPNPANTNTMIRYNIPESGEVTFRIHSVNGQILYNKAIQSERGTNTIGINTSTLSAGIYIYSMEYKGQRITKRMSIKR